MSKDKDPLVEAMVRFVKVTELCVLHGLVRATPAEEVKRMKLRQIEEELEELGVEKKNKTHPKAIKV